MLANFGVRISALGKAHNPLHHHPCPNASHNQVARDKPALLRLLAQLRNWEMPHLAHHQIVIVGYEAPKNFCLRRDNGSLQSCGYYGNPLRLDR